MDEGERGLRFLMRAPRHFDSARPISFTFSLSLSVHLTSLSHALFPFSKTFAFFTVFYFILFSFHFFFFSERFVVGPKQNETRAAPLSERIKKGPGSSTIHYTLCVHFETFLHHRRRRCC